MPHTRRCKHSDHLNPAQRFFSTWLSTWLKGRLPNTPLILSRLSVQGSDLGHSVAWSVLGPNWKPECTANRIGQHSPSSNPHLFKRESRFGTAPGCTVLRAHTRAASIPTSLSCNAPEGQGNPNWKGCLIVDLGKFPVKDSGSGCSIEHTLGLGVGLIILPDRKLGVQPRKGKMVGARGFEPPASWSRTRCKALLNPAKFCRF